MKTRNIALTLDKAKEWYNSGNDALKEAALQAYTKDELTAVDFRKIKIFDYAVRVLYGRDTDNSYSVYETLTSLNYISKASAASFKLNIIRKALNKGYEMKFTEGTIWYPVTSAVLPQNLYRKNIWETEVAKIKIGCDIFTLIGGDALNALNAGFGYFDSVSGVAGSYAGVGFLGCVTKEIAKHFGRYFAKEIFEAKYGDLIDYEWID